MVRLVRAGVCVWIKVSVRIRFKRLRYGSGRTKLILLIGERNG